VASNPLAHHLAEREAAVSALVGEALDLLGCARPTRRWRRGPDGPALVPG